MIRNTVFIKMMPIAFAGVIIATLVLTVNGYPMFQQQIPNGDKVPNPCNRSSIWMGVGHQNPMGAGTLNPFGIDFRANSFMWNKTICTKDSDGDGYTNGFELGDPNCTWVAGQTPARTYNLTHPGICEPIGSSQCAATNSWLRNCTSMNFNCPAINDSAVMNYTMRFPVSPVPAVETTYICYRFVLPNDTVADIIALQPVLDNSAIVHHMLLFGCTDEPDDAPVDETYPCAMGGGLTCTSLIGLWGFGATGQCLSDLLGFRIGPAGGLQYAVLQIHWNNPQLKANLTDSSGMKIYYTTKLRPNRGDIMMVGQNYLEIPPTQQDVAFSGSCSSACSSKLPQSLYITSSVLHMHLSGKSAIATLYRNGSLLTTLELVDPYDYNTPSMVGFDTPIEVKPGDQIVVKCVYNSGARNVTTYWGEGTSDEMCFAFFAYYPQVQGFSRCLQWKSVDICGSSTYHSDACDMMMFLKYVSALPVFCSANCSNSSCVTFLKGALATGCQRNDDVRGFLQNYIPSLLYILGYCSLALPSGNSVVSPGMMSTLPSHCPPLQGISVSMLLLMVVVWCFRRF